MDYSDLESDLPMTHHWPFNRRPVNLPSGNRPLRTVFVGHKSSIPLCLSSLTPKLRVQKVALRDGQVMVMSCDSKSREEIVQHVTEERAVRRLFLAATAHAGMIHDRHVSLLSSSQPFLGHR